MTATRSHDIQRIRADFDQIATFGDESGADRYHMPLAPTIQRMQELLRPGGRLIIHDMRRDEGLADALRAYLTLCHHALIRLRRTGRPFPPRHVRAAWLRHGKDEHYLSWREVLRTSAALLPGSRAYYHWMWRYTIVWDK